MSSLVSFAHRPSRPDAPSRELLDLVSRYQGALNPHPSDFRRKIIASDEAPGGRQRDAMEQRLSELKQSLSPASAADLRPLISALMTGWPSYGDGAQSVELMLSMYCRALDDVPLWAVQAACARFVKGRARIAWNPERAPTAPQIRAEAMREVLDAGIEAEIIRLEEVLHAEVEPSAVSDSERADALAHWEKTRREMLGTVEVSDPLNRARQAQREANNRFVAADHARAAAAGQDLPTFGSIRISAELAARLEGRARA